MVAIEEQFGRLARVEQWFVRGLEGHFSVTLLALIVGQSVMALVMSFSPLFSWASVPSENLFHDVLLYFDYSDRIFEGQVPYREFLIEYPPLGLVVFVIPRFFASTFETYKFAFCLEMLAFNAATVVLVARWTASRLGIERVPRCLAWYTLFFVLCNPMAMARSDLAVMFVAFASACLLLSGRPVAGGAMTAISVLMKIFPGAVAAPMFFRELVRLRASMPRGLITSALVFATGMAAWVAVGRGGVLEMLHYHSERGLEIGSLYAGFLMLTNNMGGEGGKLAIAFNHFALHLETPLAMRIASMAIWAQVGAMLLAIGAYCRSGMRDGLRYSTACLTAFVVFGKILSPQYMIWLIPFFPCIEGRSASRARLSFLICCGLTMLVYPLFFDSVLHSRRGVLLLNARNLALIVTYGLLVFGGQEADTDSVAP